MAKKKPAAVRPLSQQHKRFLAAYRRLRVAGRAYREIYPRASEATAETEGPRLLRMPQISSEIERLDLEVLKRQQASADQVIAELSHLGFSNVGNILWKRGELDHDGNPTTPGTIKPIEDMPPEVQRTIRSIKWDILGRPEITMWDNKGALTTLARYHKLLVDKIDVNLTTPLDKMIEQSYAENKNDE